MTTVYAIKGWDRTFENRRTRELESLSYVCWPTRQDSEAFTVLVRSPEGHAALGMFGALVQLAARCKPRGVLVDDRGPITAARYARRYGLSEAESDRLWSLLVSPEVGWLVPHVTCEARANGSALAAHIAAPTADDATTERRRGADVVPKEGEERKGQEGTKPLSAAADCPPGFAKFWAAWPNGERKTGKAKCVGLWRRMKLEPMADAIVSAVEAWKQTESWTKERGQFVPMPQTWLNGGRWEDVPGTATASTTDRKAWWASLTKAEQDAMLAEYRRTVSKQEQDKAGAFGRWCDAARLREGAKS